MVTLGSHEGTGNDQDSNRVGLPYNHVFTVLTTVELDENGTKHRLIKIRNPWNEEKFFGDWSDKSSLWDVRRLEAAGHTIDHEDGVYFMAVEHIKYNFLDMTIAYHVPNWHRTYYDVYGDDGDHNKGQYFYNDDSEYNSYTFLLTSEVDQQVYVSLYTYGDLQYVSTCYESFFYSQVWITTSEHREGAW